MDFFPNSSLTSVFYILFTNLLQIFCTRQIIGQIIEL